jgi:hypothetical protein
MFGEAGGGASDDDTSQTPGGDEETLKSDERVGCTLLYSCWADLHHAPAGPAYSNGGLPSYITNARQGFMLIAQRARKNSSLKRIEYPRY